MYHGSKFPKERLNAKTKKGQADKDEDVEETENNVSGDEVDGRGKKPKRPPPKQIFVLFPPPPYTKKSSEMYNKCLEEKTAVHELPANWKLYNVKSRARAGEFCNSISYDHILIGFLYPQTLEEAHAKLSLLKTEEHAWSLSDDNVGDAEDETIDEIRIANLMAQSGALIQSYQQSIAASANSTGLVNVMNAVRNFDQSALGTYQSQLITASSQVAKSITSSSGQSHLTQGKKPGGW
ncbi:hypothetical protein QAD02_004826 [Eretmocerus hayati]|uniref:Uncharacterized protein n=1 Tax=Eretmocerus hayati TaxID=131215 RepID=A0ACC2NTC5_9HYME|nr:hypothetical protein QAD02_004826 [Eretmocerus hayati]